MRKLTISTSDYRDVYGKAPKATDRGYFTFGITLSGVTYYQDDFDGTYAEAKAYVLANAVEKLQKFAVYGEPNCKVTVELESATLNAPDPDDDEEPERCLNCGGVMSEGTTVCEQCAFVPETEEELEPSKTVEIRRTNGHWEAYEGKQFCGWNDDRIELEDCFLKRGYGLTGEVAGPELRERIARTHEYFLQMADDPKAAMEEVTRYRVFLFALRQMPDRVFDIIVQPSVPPCARFKAVSFDGNTIKTGANRETLRGWCLQRGWVEECFVPESATLKPDPSELTTGRLSCDKECLANHVAAVGTEGGQISCAASFEIASTVRRR